MNYKEVNSWKLAFHAKTTTMQFFYLVSILVCVTYLIVYITERGKGVTAEWLRGMVTKLSHPCDC